jgi:hypothetical protein
MYWILIGRDIPAFAQLGRSWHHLSFIHYDTHFIFTKAYESLTFLDGHPFGHKITPCGGHFDLWTRLSGFHHSFFVLPMEVGSSPPWPWCSAFVPFYYQFWTLTSYYYLYFIPGTLVVWTEIHLRAILGSAACSVWDLLFTILGVSPVSSTSEIPHTHSLYQYNGVCSTRARDLGIFCVCRNWMFHNARFSNADV